MKKIRVLIVDDHALVREGIRSLLALVSDIEIIGEAADGKQAIERVKHLIPDIVLMDLNMPGMSGLAAIRRIHKEYPATKVLALTQYDDSEYVLPVIEAGARGFVTKMSSSSELASAIQAVYRGESYLSPSAAAAVVNEFQTGVKREKDAYSRLTEREKEVLKLLAEGNSARKVAEALFVSPKTVEWYKTRLMNKLDIHNRTELIKFAIRKSIIRL